MSTRSGALNRRNQPRKTRFVNRSSSDPLYAQNTFAGLPYDVKYHFLHEFHFSPSDLLSLSQVSRAWRECATGDSVWAPWYEVLPEDVKAFTRLCRNISKRDFVMLGLTAKCMGCKAWASLISAPLKLRLCETCLVDNPLYRCVDENTRRLYDLKPKDLQKLASYSVEALNVKTPQSYVFVSERSLIDIAITKHGGTLESMNGHITSLQLRAKEDYDRKIALRLEERAAAWAQGLPFRKHTPRNTRELTWGEIYNNDFGPMWPTIDIGTLYYKNEKMHYADMGACAFCIAEQAELYLTKYGVHLPSFENPTRSQSLDEFKMTRYLMPEWKDNNDFGAHSSGHFTSIKWSSPCTDTCKMAKLINGEGTCEVCCRERALRKHLGDEGFEEEMLDAIQYSSDEL